MYVKSPLPYPRRQIKVQTSGRSHGFGANHDASSHDCLATVTGKTTPGLPTEYYIALVTSKFIFPEKASGETPIIYLWQTRGAELYLLGPRLCVLPITSACR